MDTVAWGRAEETAKSEGDDYRCAELCNARVSLEKRPVVDRCIVRPGLSQHDRRLLLLPQSRDSEFSDHAEV